VVSVQVSKFCFYRAIPGIKLSEMVRVVESDSYHSILQSLYRSDLDMCLAVTKLNMKYVITLVMNKDFLFSNISVMSLQVMQWLKSRPNSEAKNRSNKMKAAKVVGFHMNNLDLSKTKQYI
jgi:hypothetical protein